MTFTADFFEFISKNIDAEPNRLRLKYYNATEYSFDMGLAIAQIECRQRIRRKLPSIAAEPRFLFPSTLLAEQCTDELVAQFHGSLFNGCRTVLDMTAGLCIDDIAIASHGCKVTGIEIDTNAAEIARHNMVVMNANVDIICGDSADFIADTDLRFDAIFVDPARRDSHSNRVYDIADCSPNIIALMPLILKRCSYLIVKASPMIDINDTLARIDGITDIWVVAIKNECKEVLIRVSADKSGSEPSIHTVNYTDSDGTAQRFDFNARNGRTSSTPAAMPQAGGYILEPNACIMKAGAFAALADAYGIAQIDNNTHIFVSDKYIADFPGRVFAIDEIIPYKERELKGFGKSYPHINVATRNFPLTAEQLRKKLRCNDGGNQYLFGVGLNDRSCVLIIGHKP